MFTRIQTQSFRCLRAVDQSLGPFHALVGPNASGKSTFLDVIGFLGRLARERGSVWDAIESMSSTFQDLVWLHQGGSFELAIEARIPKQIQNKMAEARSGFAFVRYEIEVGLDPERNEVGLNHETLWLKEPDPHPQTIQRNLFPDSSRPAHGLKSKAHKGLKTSLKKQPGGNDTYYPEGRKTWVPSFRLGRTKSALANLPADEDSFPVSTWFRNLLEDGVQSVVLNSLVIRQPSPPGLGRRFQTDGSNLPWVVAELRKDPPRFQAWLDHVRTALEDIADIDTVERSEDRHRYLVIEYANGARVPSWLASDGTLRLLALTIPAYLGDLQGVFLIEEPENGIHPRAIETVLQSLSSMYGSQVLIATHSPVALNLLDARQVLCFAKNDEGATDIISGDIHPALREWKNGQPDLGVLFAAGILG